MKQTTITCDISEREHFSTVKEYTIDVIFDHDQEDGRSKCKPYFDKEKIDICVGCMNYMLENRRYIYAYGAMGHNKYYLDS